MDDKNNEMDQKVDDVMLPGFRFHPTDEELVGFYLKRKILQQCLPIELIKQVDIYKYDPWDLPKLASTGEKEWYFYCPRDRKYRNSTRPNRVTGAGFWKATGTDRPIYSSDGAKCIGLKKSLVFYRGRAAKGIKTDWMMHEFRLPSLSDSAPPKKLFDKNLPPNDSWAICRIFKKINSIAQRALSHSWISPIITPTETTTAAASDIFNHQGAASNFTEFSPENMSCTTEAAGPSIQLCNISDHLQQYQQQHNSSTTAAFSSMNFVPPYYKPIHAPASKTTNVFSTSNPTTDQAHNNFILSTLEMSGYPKSSPTVDFSSLFLNLSPAVATTDVPKATETIGFGRLQPSPSTLQEQFNGFPMISSLHEMQGGSMTGSAGEEQMGLRRSHGTNSTQVGNHQWGSSIRSMGFPLNLPAEIWKPATLLSSWESPTAAAASAACPSEISNTH